MKDLRVGFWRGAGIPTTNRTNRFVVCGCCGAYHRADFWGDCREDSERFETLPDDAVLCESEGGDGDTGVDETR